VKFKELEAGGFACVRDNVGSCVCFVLIGEGTTWCSWVTKLGDSGVLLPICPSVNAKIMATRRFVME
jgi:hypothetical protein